MKLYEVGGGGNFVFVYQIIREFNGLCMLRILPFYYENIYFYYSLHLDQLCITLMDTRAFIPVVIRL